MTNWKIKPLTIRSATVLSLLAVVASCTQKRSDGEPKAVNPDAVKVEFFVMSQCPYGVEVVNHIKEAADKLGPDLDLSIDFIGDIKADGSLTSMHGQNEVTGDIVQLCAAKHAPKKYLEMMICQNRNYRDVASNWVSCAESLKLPVELIRTCLNGEEGKQLLKNSFQKAQNRSARGSPTIYIAGNRYNGRRSPQAFLRAICAAHKGANSPQSCKNLPEPPQVNILILSDKRCSECSTERYVGFLKSTFENPSIKVLDYSDEEGSKLYSKLGTPSLLPLILFDKTLDLDKGSAQLAKQTRTLGNYRSLPLNSSWNPTCADQGGCEKPECRNSFACRKEVPKQLELFVMSQCPYGVQALNAMDEVLQAFGNQMSFQVHYIANSDGQGGFRALHGKPEVDENIRELCAIKYYPKNYQWMDYVLCRNHDIRSNSWEECTSARQKNCPTAKAEKGKSSPTLTAEQCSAAKKINAKVIRRCFEGSEGKKLLEEDIKTANSLGIGASPTWVVNGKHKFSALDAESIRRNFCDKNDSESLEGCKKSLSQRNKGAARGGCGN